MQTVLRSLSAATVRHYMDAAAGQNDIFIKAFRQTRSLRKKRDIGYRENMASGNYYAELVTSTDAPTHRCINVSTLGLSLRYSMGDGAEETAMARPQNQPFDRSSVATSQSALLPNTRSQGSGSGGSGSSAVHIGAWPSAVTYPCGAGRVPSSLP